MLPGYAQGYRLRACLVVPRGDGPDPAPSVAEYLQSGPPPAPLQVVPPRGLLPGGHPKEGEGKIEAGQA